MLFQQHGINFNDYPTSFRRGTFVRRVAAERTLSPEELLRIPAAHRPTGPVVRSQIEAFHMPRLLSIQNRVQALFDGAGPVFNEPPVENASREAKG